MILLTVVILFIKFEKVKLQSEKHNLLRKVQFIQKIGMFPVLPLSGKLLVNYNYGLAKVQYSVINFQTISRLYTYNI